MAGAQSLNSGEYRIRGFGYTAATTRRGASLRSLAFAGRDLVVPFASDEARPAMRGALMAPWPNRLADGSYRFDGNLLHLPITEPSRGNAIHGLVADIDFDLVAHRRDAVTLGATIEGRPGYPWRLQLRVTLALAAAGLTHTVVARNVSHRRAPFGLGVHPYLLAGLARPGAIDAWELQVPADRVLLTTRARCLPGALVPVENYDGGVFDLREHHAIGARELNHAFTGLRRGSDGLARIRLTDGRGTGVEAALDSAYRWVHIYTSDEVHDRRPRTGVAVEPTTCPPNAFNSGHDLIVLRPGQSARASFGLRALTPSFHGPGHADDAT